MYGSRLLGPFFDFLIGKNMSINNCFKFYNVGHGLFYTGRIGNNFKFVFDCGSNSKNHKLLIDNAIKLEFELKSKIDYMFISHFHEDHCNGIRNLQKTCEISNFIIPYISSENSKYEDVIFSYFSLILKDKNLNKNYFYNLIEKYLYRDNDNSEIEKVNDNLCFINGINNKLINLKWKFKILCKHISISDLNNIKIELSDLFKGKSKEEFFKYITRDEWKKLKGIYKKYCGNDLNLSSLILIHYPVCKGEDVKHISVLTGDAIFDKGINGYFKNIPYIEFFQLPHHGSYENYKSINDEIINNTINFYIPFGIGSNEKQIERTICELEEKNKNINFAFQNYEYPISVNNIYSIKIGGNKNENE